MAKISVEFDTVEKTLAVTKDGEAMADVWGVSVSKSWMDEKKFSCDLTMVTKDEANDLTTITRVSASENGELVVAERRPKFADDVAAFFSRK